jgi:siroheme synthase (precorrin-2 oxidase/ferrochelatase)
MFDSKQGTGGRLENITIEPYVWIVVFWVTTPCDLLCGYRRFGREMLSLPWRKRGHNVYKKRRREAEKQKMDEEEEKRRRESRRMRRRGWRKRKQGKRRMNEEKE